jgi:uncharacterized protein YeaO (DUF488 family)
MPIQIIRLGTPRLEGEGIRIGTVRRPPCGVKKSDHAAQNWYDVWLPDVAPSPELMKQGQAVRTDTDWAAFARKYRRELAAPEKPRSLRLLAALSASGDFSIGCYCEDRNRCHIAVLSEVLVELGAVFTDGG